MHEKRRKSPYNAIKLYGHHFLIETTVFILQCKTICNLYSSIRKLPFRKIDLSVFGILFTEYTCYLIEQRRGNVSICMD